MFRHWKSEKNKIEKIINVIVIWYGEKWETGRQKKVLTSVYTICGLCIIVIQMHF